MNDNKILVDDIQIYQHTKTIRRTNFGEIKLNRNIEHIILKRSANVFDMMSTYLPLLSLISPKFVLRMILVCWLFVYHQLKYF
jgi:hypothetical protein